MHCLPCRFQAVQRGEEEAPPPERTSSFLWKLLEHAEQAENELTSEDWAYNITIAYLAGHETTRWAATAMLLHLDQNPAIVEELKAEMAAAQAVRRPAPLPAAALCACAVQQRTIYADARAANVARACAGARRGRLGGARGGDADAAVRGGHCRDDAPQQCRSPLRRELGQHPAARRARGHCVLGLQDPTGTGGDFRDAAHDPGARRLCCAGRHLRPALRPAPLHSGAPAVRYELWAAAR